MKRKNKLILEWTEFNVMRFNSDNAGTGAPIVDNPDLSLNAFDKHQDIIRQSISRINDILYNLKGSSAYADLRSRLGLENQDISNLKILRIVKEQVRFNVYLTVIIEGKEYWGEIKDILGTPTLYSEIFKDDSLLQPKEWVIKTKGIIIKTIKKWLKPEPGIYRLLNDEVICYSTVSGKQFKMTKGIEIELLRSHDDKIIIIHENEYYNLVNDNYVYFNWWFEPV